MELLDAEETLIVETAKATCLTFRLDRQSTPVEDLDLYVDELCRLYSIKPLARTATRPADPSADVRSAMKFCVQQLEDASPRHANRLRTALATP